MAIAKVILNGEVQMDVTSDTVEANKLLEGETATKNDGTKVTGTFVASDPKIEPLAILPSVNNDSIFDGTNAAVLVFSDPSLSEDGTNITATVIVDVGTLSVGEVYNINVENAIYIDNDTAQYDKTALYISINSEWIASEEPTSVQFTATPENESLFDGSFGVIDVKLSMSFLVLTIKKTETFYLNQNDVEFRVTTPSSVDGYMPVAVLPIGLKGLNITPTSTSQTFTPTSSDFFGIAQTSTVSTSDWISITEYGVDADFYKNGHPYQLVAFVEKSEPQAYGTYASTIFWSNGGSISIPYSGSSIGAAMLTISATSSDCRYKLEADNISDGWNMGFRVGYQVHGYGQVQVSAIPSSYIIPSGTYSISSSGVYSISPYANVDVHTIPKLLSKTVTPTESEQIIIPEETFIITDNDPKTVYDSFIDIELSNRRSFFDNNSFITFSGSFALNGTTVNIPTQTRAIYYNGRMIVAGDKLTTDNSSIVSYVTLVDDTVNGLRWRTLLANSGTATLTDVNITCKKTPTTDTQCYYLRDETSPVTRSCSFSNFALGDTIVLGGTLGEYKAHGNLNASTHFYHMFEWTGSSYTYYPSSQTSYEAINIIPSASKITVGDYLDYGVFGIGKLNEYDGLSQVTVNAIASDYIGSAIPLKSSADLIVWGPNISTPSGYYSSTVFETVSAGSITSKGWTFTKTSDPARFNIKFTASINSGYFTSSTINNTYGLVLESKTVTPTESSQTVIPYGDGYYLDSVTVGAIPSSYIIPSGTYSVTENGVYDIGSYASVDVSVAGGGGDENAFIMRSFSSTVYENSTLTKIGPGAFMAVSTLSAVSVPNVTEIGSMAFAYNQLNLVSYSSMFNFSSVVSIGTGAFFSAFSRISGYGGNMGIFPEAIYVGSYAFAKNRGGGGVFPALSSMGEGAFIGCNTVPICSVLSEIPAYCFVNTNQAYISSTMFPNVESIGSRAFVTAYNNGKYDTYTYESDYIRLSITMISDNRSLDYASFPKVKNIGYQAFASCRALHKVDFPECIDIGEGAFYSCPNLSSIYFPKCKVVGMSAFKSCGYLSSVDFPLCETIGTEAFGRCNSLYTISFPVATVINQAAFQSCFHLQSAVFPSVINVSSRAFSTCSSLTTISFPVAEVVGSYAFYSCTKLTAADFPSATIMYTNAFAYCSSLTTANFPEVTTISDNAFAYCSKLYSISFPKATTIDMYAFRNCYSLTTVNFPAVTSMGSYAFYYCWGLTTATFSSFVTTMGNSIFYGCSSLTTVRFSEVTTISNNAFYSCQMLLSLYLLGSTVPFLGTNVFYSTPISNYTAYTGGVYGSIFVRASLYNAFITANGWSIYSSRIVSLTDTEIAAL